MHIYSNIKCKTKFKKIKKLSNSENKSAEVTQMWYLTWRIDNWMLEVFDDNCYINLLTHLLTYLLNNFDSQIPYLQAVC